MNLDAIILDEGYSRGLIRQALQDGFASPVEVSDEDDREVQKSIITDYKRSKLSQRALEHLLLYPAVHLYHGHDYIDLAKLKTHVSIESMLPDSVTSTPIKYLGSDEGYRMAKAFKPLILPNLRYQSRNAAEAFKVTSKSYDTYIDALRDVEGEFPELALHPGHYEFFLPGMAKMLGVSEEKIYQLNLENPEKLGTYAAITTVYSMGPVNAVATTLVDTIGLTKASGNLGIPAASSWATSKTYARGNQLTTEYSNEDALRCFYVFLEEVDAFPVVTTIDDVLRLRGDKRIENWRQAIQEWTTELKSGNPKSEQEMRASIRSAMRDLRRRGRVRSVSGIMTILALPLGIAELMVGIIGPGFAMTGLGATLELYSRATEWKYDWLLLGRIK